MNIRLQNSSVRFRISRDEMQQLLAEKRLLANTPLPGSMLFTYCIYLDEEAKDLTLESGSGFINLHVPKAAALNLACANRCREGINTEQSLDNGNRLLLSLQVDIRRHRSE